jgi:hypothetical protein
MFAHRNPYKFREKIITTEEPQSDTVTKRKDNTHITNTSDKSEICTNYMDSKRTIHGCCEQFQTHKINNINEPIHENNKL